MPYLQSIEKIKGGWSFSYNGGELEVALKEVDCVLFYGASCDIPLTLLDEFNKYGITALLHRRGIATPYVFHCSNTTDTANDILTGQILARENDIKRNFIAKSLIRGRLRTMEWLIEIPASHYTQLRAEKRHHKVVAMEANHSKRYWQAYAEKLGLIEWNRRSDNPVSAALDACSYFVATMLLRWVLFHKLSPAHAYLHKPTTYISLVYDLMEPYRYLFEQAVYEAYQDGGETNLTERSVSILKQKLEEWCYVPTQKGYVRRKNLLHGIVLALRAYLLKEVKLIVLPLEGEKIGGRPVNSGYVIPGKKEKI
ncbi:MAG: CRISPR-associated endonuclease Cas1 [Thiotrichales bacterium]|nr:CRISPR-associated endonuclease Cas1 [Thiotrichales bacterium]